MRTFRDLLCSAKNGDTEAMNELLEMYRLLLINNSLIDGVVDEDMYQELCYKFITAVVMWATHF